MKASKIGFASVGAFAAAVHYGMAVSANAFGFSPVFANWIGFICAFPLSYMGHRAWSFKGTQSAKLTSLVKYSGVALTGFISNQVVLVLMMKLTSMPFWMALACAVTILTLISWTLSRYWAFNS